MRLPLTATFPYLLRGPCNHYSPTSHVVCNIRPFPLKRGSTAPEQKAAFCCFPVSWRDRLPVWLMWLMPQSHNSLMNCIHIMLISPSAETRISLETEIYFLYESNCRISSFWKIRSSEEIRCETSLYKGQRIQREVGPFPWNRHPYETKYEMVPKMLWLSLNPQVVLGESLELKLLR